MAPANLTHITSYIIKKLKKKGIDIDGDFVKDQEMGLESNLAMGVVVNLKSI